MWRPYWSENYRLEEKPAMRVTRWLLVGSGKPDEMREKVLAFSRELMTGSRRIPRVLRLERIDTLQDQDVLLDLLCEGVELGLHDGSRLW